MNQAVIMEGKGIKYTNSKGVNFEINRNDTEGLKKYLDFNKVCP